MTELRGLQLISDRINRARDMDELLTTALQRALDADGPALLELRVDPEAISTATTLSALRRG